MRWAVAPLGALLLSGCVYLNTLYNAQDAWARGERARLAGDDALARASWSQAAEKAGRAYRKDPDGEWADTSLLTLGRAWFRLGRWQDARGALAAAIELTDDPELVAEARVYLGAVDAAIGADAAALRTLNEVLSGELAAVPRAEGHMWRARTYLRQGEVDLGWWDLDRAAEADRRLVIPAHLERVRWGIAAKDRGRALSGATALLEREEGVVWADSLEVLVRGAARMEEWGAGGAAELLASARGGPWAPERRNGLLFLRADLLMQAGDTLAAETELGAVASGVGRDAADARLRLAEIRLHRALTPIELESVRRVLLPAVGDARVLERLEELRVLELLTIWGLQGDPVAYFAAAEFARDRLETPTLARGLFLAMAEADPDGPWSGKALLAALALTRDAGTRETLRLAIERRGRDPYVLASRNDYVDPARLSDAEAALEARTAELRARARTEAGRRDVEIRSRSGGGAGEASQ